MMKVIKAKWQQDMPDLCRIMLTRNTVPVITLIQYLSSVGVFLLPNSCLIPPLADCDWLFCFTFPALAGCCCWVSLASSFGDELDFFTAEGKSASAGEELGFGLATSGGDLVKKLKMELCFAMSAPFFRKIFSELSDLSLQTSPSFLDRDGALLYPVRGKRTTTFLGRGHKRRPMANAALCWRKSRDVYIASRFGAQSFFFLQRTLLQYGNITIKYYNWLNWFWLNF